MYHTNTWIAFLFCFEQMFYLVGLMVGGWSVRRYFLSTAGGEKVLFGRFDG
jgi:hypothetical protein